MVFPVNVHSDQMGSGAQGTQNTHGDHSGRAIIEKVRGILSEIDNACANVTCRCTNLSNPPEGMRVVETSTLDGERGLRTLIPEKKGRYIWTPPPVDKRPQLDPSHSCFVPTLTKHSYNCHIGLAPDKPPQQLQSVPDQHRAVQHSPPNKDMYNCDVAVTPGRPHQQHPNFTNECKVVECGPPNKEQHWPNQQRTGPPNHHQPGIVLDKPQQHHQNLAGQFKVVGSGPISKEQHWPNQQITGPPNSHQPGIVLDKPQQPHQNLPDQCKVVGSGPIRKEQHWPNQQRTGPPNIHVGLLLDKPHQQFPNLADRLRAVQPSPPDREMPGEMFAITCTPSYCMGAKAYEQPSASPFQPTSSTSPSQPHRRDYCEDPSFVAPEPAGHQAWSNEPSDSCRYPEYCKAHCFEHGPARDWVRR